MSFRESRLCKFVEAPSEQEFPGRDNQQVTKKTSAQLKKLAESVAVPETVRFEGLRSNRNLLGANVQLAPGLVIRFQPGVQETVLFINGVDWRIQPSQGRFLLESVHANGTPTSPPTKLVFRFAANSGMTRRTSDMLLQEMLQGFGGLSTRNGESERVISWR